MNSGSQEKSNVKSKNSWKWMKMAAQYMKFMGCSISRVQRVVYSNQYIHKESRKVANKLSKNTSQGPRKQEQTKPKISRKNDIIKYSIGCFSKSNQGQQRNKWLQNWEGRSQIIHA